MRPVLKVLGVRGPVKAEKMKTDAPSSGPPIYSIGHVVTILSTHPDPRSVSGRLRKKWELFIETCGDPGSERVVGMGYPRAYHDDKYYNLEDTVYEWMSTTFQEEEFDVLYIMELEGGLAAEAAEALDIYLDKKIKEYMGDTDILEL